MALSPDCESDMDLTRIWYTESWQSRSFRASHQSDMNLTWVWFIFKIKEKTMKVTWEWHEHDILNYDNFEILGAGAMEAPRKWHESVWSHVFWVAIKVPWKVIWKWCEYDMGEVPWRAMNLPWNCHESAWQCLHMSLMFLFSALFCQTFSIDAFQVFYLIKTKG